jgi:hypothetical protein
VIETAHFRGLSLLDASVIAANPPLGNRPAFARAKALWRHRRNAARRGGLISGVLPALMDGLAAKTDKH